MLTIQLNNLIIPNYKPPFVSKSSKCLSDTILLNFTRKGKLNVKLTRYIVKTKLIIIFFFKL